MKIPVKCLRCGHEMDIDLTQESICSECGEEFDQGEHEEEKTPPIAAKKSTRIN